MINDRQSEDPPGTFDGVPGYVIARIDEVTLFKRVLNVLVLLLSISSFYLSCGVVWCGVLCCPVLFFSLSLTSLFSSPLFASQTLCPTHLYFLLSSILKLNRTLSFLFTTCSVQKILVISSILL